MDNGTMIVFTIKSFISKTSKKKKKSNIELLGKYCSLKVNTSLNAI